MPSSSANTHTGRLIQNADRQPRRSTIKAPMVGPDATPSAPIPPTQEMTCVRFSLPNAPREKTGRSRKQQRASSALNNTTDNQDGKRFGSGADRRAQDFGGSEESRGRQSVSDSIQPITGLLSRVSSRVSNSFLVVDSDVSICSGASAMKRVSPLPSPKPLARL